MLKQLEKEKVWKIGLLQALLVALYCGFVATFFSYISQILPRPGYFGFFLMLVLLVFSAAVTGSLVFAYPVYLAVMKRKIGAAAAILVYTMIFSSAIILGTIVFLVTVVPQL